MKGPTSTEQRLRSEIGKRIERLRLRAGLTQTQLGARAGKEQGTISRIEHGEYRGLTIGLLIDLAYGLGCEPSDLFEWPIGIMDVAAHDPGRAQLAEAS
ncbi:MAG: Helix-turn-helix domain [Acidimicrobiales bacterium]|nr:Helix-turn-helix domain [Acidimicrobiales bacterium]